MEEKLCRSSQEQGSIHLAEGRETELEVVRCSALIPITK